MIVDIIVEFNLCIVRFVYLSGCVAANHRERNKIERTSPASWAGKNMS